MKTNFNVRSTFQRLHLVIFDSIFWFQPIETNERVDVRKPSFWFYTDDLKTPNGVLITVSI